MKLQAFLPLITYTDPIPEASAINAVKVAALLEADLNALVVNVVVPQVASALPRFVIDVPDMIRQAEATSRNHGERLVAAINAAAGSAQLALSVETQSETPPLLAATASIAARYHDISLVGWEAENPTARITAESLVFGSGRPVTLLPADMDIAALDHVAIAWDGSRVAARSVTDARPFLARAGRISVLSVVDEKPIGAGDGERLAASLRQAGLDAEAVTLNGGRRDIATTLQEGARERGAGLLVMGGYGHSRVRDFVMGGATEGVLKSLSMPVMLSH